MNLWEFLLVWILVYIVPIPPTRSRIARVGTRLGILLVGLFLFFILTAALTPMSIFVYWLIYSRLFLAFLEYVFQVAGTDRTERPEKAQSFSSDRLARRRLKIATRVSAKVVAVLFVLFLLSGIVAVVYTQSQRVSNAVYFNGFIQPESGLPFSQPIPDNLVRLVTEELAISVARRHMSEFGSNMRVLDSHITKTPEGKLVWIAVIGSTNVLAENYVKGFILVDATDPTAAPEIIHKEFAVGQGLWWDRDIIFRSYLSENKDSYGVAYPSWDSATGELVYLVARYEVGFDFIRRYRGLIVYDSEGRVIADYSALSSVPSWVTQVYDEDWMEHMINEWGGFRRGNSFDYWSGGFLWIIPPSRDRVEMSEDTRYIIDPETGDLIAMVMVNPVASERTLTGVFKATRQGISFYDYSQEDYISGMSAEDFVEGKLPLPTSGFYDAEMPLLYPVEVSTGTYRLAWYVPVYWREGIGQPDETIYLAGFAIMDARDTSKLAINMAVGGLSGEQLVRNTRLDFTKLFGAVVTHVDIKATVVDKQEYVKDGVTHIVLHVDNSTYPWIETTPNDLPSQQWYELLSTKPGDLVNASIEKRGEIWTMVQFDNINIASD